jgi:hypothetical protein
MHKSPWPDRDDDLRREHAKGGTWGDIARRLGGGISTYAAKKRGAMIGLSNVHMASVAPPPRRGHQMPEEVALQGAPELPTLRGRGGVLQRGVSTLPPLPSLQMPMPKITGGRG